MSATSVTRHHENSNTDGQKMTKCQ